MQRQYGWMVWGSQTVRKHSMLMWSARSGCLTRASSAQAGIAPSFIRHEWPYCKCPFLEKLVHFTRTYLRVSLWSRPIRNVCPRTRPVHERASPPSAGTPPPHSRVTRDREVSLECLITPLIGHASTRSGVSRLKY